MAIQGKPRAGKGGRVSSGGVNMVLQNWQATDKIEEADATNFEGGGFAEELDCIRSCDASFSGVWDAHHQPYVNPPNFTPGVFLANTTLYINVADTTSYIFPSFFVVSVAVTVNVHQAVQVSITGKSDGTFTVPAGNQ